MSRKLLAAERTQMTRTKELMQTLLATVNTKLTAEEVTRAQAMATSVANSNHPHAVYFTKYDDMHMRLMDMQQQVRRVFYTHTPPSTAQADTMQVWTESVVFIELGGFHDPAAARLKTTLLRKLAHNDTKFKFECVVDEKKGICLMMIPDDASPPYEETWERFCQQARNAKAQMQRDATYARLVLTKFVFDTNSMQAVVDDAFDRRFSCAIVKDEAELDTTCFYVEEDFGDDAFELDVRMVRKLEGEEDELFPRLLWRFGVNDDPSSFLRTATSDQLARLIMTMTEDFSNAFFYHLQLQLIEKEQATM